MTWESGACPNMNDWLKIDLHIHSSLSPCAEDEMTPNNIVNMARLLGLSIIAVTDHQAADNVAAVMQVAARYGITCVPGIEVQTKEEVHLLAYFPDVLKLQHLAQVVQAHFADDRPASPYFGRQLIVDEADHIVGEHRALLHQSTMLTVEQVWELAEQFGGCCVPAHMDRPAFGLLSQLGFLPKTLPIATVEYSQAYFARQGDRFTDQEPLAIISSDAHALAQMVTPASSWLRGMFRTSGQVCQALKEGDHRNVRTSLNP